MGNHAIDRNMKQLILVAALLGFALGCLPKKSGTEDTRDMTLVSDSKSSIEAVLPDDWYIAKVSTNDHPFYREKGRGTSYGLAVQGKSYPKAPYEATIWIMPPDYSDIGVKGKLEDDVRGNQTFTPQLIIDAANGKVFLWPPGHTPDWPTMKEDLEKALTRPFQQSE
jgi:hypothetical protein